MCGTFSGIFSSKFLDTTFLRTFVGGLFGATFSLKKALELFTHLSSLACLLLLCRSPLPQPLSLASLASTCFWIGQVSFWPRPRSPPRRRKSPFLFPPRPLPLAVAVVVAVVAVACCPCSPPLLAVAVAVAGVAVASRS